jgi:hypothetical protein
VRNHSRSREKQRLKIEEIGRTLADCGLVALDEQARALGLCRSTAWTVLRGLHKSSGLSATTINRMLAAHHLPTQVRTKILEYVAEKMSGSYGDQKHRLKAFASKIGRNYLAEVSVGHGHEVPDKTPPDRETSHPCEARLPYHREMEAAGAFRPHYRTGDRLQGVDEPIRQPRQYRGR